MSHWQLAEPWRALESQSWSAGQTCTSSSVFHGGRVGNLAMWDIEALGEQDSCLCSNFSLSRASNPAPVPYLRSMAGQSHGKLQRKIKRGSIYSWDTGWYESEKAVLIPWIMDCKKLWSQFCAEWEDIFQPCRHWISQCSLLDNIYTWKEESIISSPLRILSK